MKTIFIACSRRFYPQVKAIKEKLDHLGVKGFYPYFDFHSEDSETNEELKKKLTMGHFPELDQIDTLYVYAENGYVGYSSTIEIAYSYAKGKEIISSEPITELAVRALVSKVMTPDEFIVYAQN